MPSCFIEVNRVVYVRQSNKKAPFESCCVSRDNLNNPLYLHSFYVLNQIPRLSQDKYRHNTVTPDNDTDMLNMKGLSWLTHIYRHVSVMQI
jgi:hypothetical protein